MTTDLLNAAKKIYFSGYNFVSHCTQKHRPNRQKKTIGSRDVFSPTGRARVVVNGMREGGWGEIGRFMKEQEESFRQLQRGMKINFGTPQREGKHFLQNPGFIFKVACVYRCTWRDRFLSLSPVFYGDFLLFCTQVVSGEISASYRRLKDLHLITVICIVESCISWLKVGQRWPWRPSLLALN